MRALGLRGSQSLTYAFPMRFGRVGCGADLRIRLLALSSLVLLRRGSNDATRPEKEQLVASRDLATQCSVVAVECASVRVRAAVVRGAGGEDDDAVRQQR